MHLICCNTKPDIPLKDIKNSRYTFTKVFPLSNKNIRFCVALLLYHKKPKKSTVIKKIKVVESTTLTFAHRAKISLCFKQNITRRKANITSAKLTYHCNAVTRHYFTAHLILVHFERLFRIISSCEGRITSLATLL